MKKKNLNIKNWFDGNMLSEMHITEFIMVNVSLTFVFNAFSSSQSHLQTNALIVSRAAFART